MKDNNGRSGLRTFLVILGLIFLYAFAVQITEIDLKEPLKPNRQENLVALIRKLALPDLFDFDEETRTTDISLRMPCPEEIKGSQVSVEGRRLTLVPNCVSTIQDVMTLTGEGFPPNVSGVVRWHPVDSEITRNPIPGNFRTDANGYFELQFTMPDVRPAEETQRLEVIEVLSRSIAGPSAATKITIERITETVLMALIASTIGTFLAIPISFMAARNLMESLNSPLAAIMGGLILAPLGAAAGWLVTQQLATWTTQLNEQSLLGLGAFIVSTALIVPLVRLDASTGDADTAPANSLLAPLRLLGITLLLLFSLANLVHLGPVAGGWLEDILGPLAFVGNFITVLADLLGILLPITAALTGGLLMLNFGSRYGQDAILRMEESRARLLTVVLATVGTFVIVFGLAYCLHWVNLLGLRERTLAGYPEFLDVLPWLLIPAVAIGLLAGLLATSMMPKRPFPIGNIIYTLTRGTLNLTRAIEPLMMGFVFVVWVGLGPFAGILALTLHSVADLGKLFSEQVENIDDGPLEAVTATGANRIQTIIYAVVPQIVPHYIAYIFYRWDINVRMSTIIGFVGGGGIGFVLQRHVNQLQYSQASVMIISIAIVVTVLDNISSRIRRRII